MDKEKDPMAGIMDLMKVAFLVILVRKPFIVCLVLYYFSTENQSLSVLLQNMYEEGDEDMKRTIGKAWTDARSGKTVDPMKNFS